MTRDNPWLIGTITGTLSLLVAAYRLAAQSTPPEIVRIDQPVVSQRTAEYSNVRFRRGDTVDVQAGGCAQTGGSGKTWKRYVNPGGAGADHLYHGLIYIPGAMLTVGRVADVIGKTMIVTTAPDPARPFLQLGYEDDDYSDNGYYRHDDGNNDQCKGVGDAYVIVSIRHATPRGRPPADGVTPATSSPAKSPSDIPQGSLTSAPLSSAAAKGFLETLPGIITATAGLITAIGTLIAVLLRSSKASTSGQP
jgi:hypothetical protein